MIKVKHAQRNMITAKNKFTKTKNYNRVGVMKKENT